MTRLILLDRDGVINQDSDEFVKTVDEFLPIAGSIETIARLHQAGLMVGVCSNQSGVGRGLLTEAMLGAIHNRLRTLVEEAGGQLVGIAYCPHLPEEHCSCRKPEPGLLLELMAGSGVQAIETVFVGDSLRDVEAAIAAGCRAVLVRTGNGRKSEAAVRALGINEVHDSLNAFGKAELERLRGRQGLVGDEA